MSLFWLRQVANLFIAVSTYFLKGKVSIRGDEMQLAIHLNINIWSIQLFSGLAGLLITFLVLHMMPKKVIITFLTSGLIGGVLGYYLWLIRFGPMIMP